MNTKTTFFLKIDKILFISCCVVGNVLDCILEVIESKLRRFYSVHFLNKKKTFVKSMTPLIATQLSDGLNSVTVV